MSNTLWNVWGHIYDSKLPNGYVVAYGNEYHGDHYKTKQEFLSNYKLILRRAFRQDVSIYYNGKQIRSIRNFNQKITNKTVQYTCEIIKY